MPGHRFANLAEFGHQRVGAVGPSGGKSRACGFHFSQCRTQIGGADRLALQQQAQHVGGADLGRRVHDGPAPVAAPYQPSANSPAMI